MNVDNKQVCMRMWLLRKYVGDTGVYQCMISTYSLNSHTAVLTSIMHGYNNTKLNF